MALSRHGGVIPSNAVVNHSLGAIGTNSVRGLVVSRMRRVTKLAGTELSF